MEAEEEKKDKAEEEGVEETHILKEPKEEREWTLLIDAEKM